MSNIIEGDSVKNFGEFIPNPYIEKVTVAETGTTNIINLNIEYSLLFLVGDQFDINDVADLFYDNTINIYGLLEARTTNSPSTREDLVTDIHNENVDDTKPIRTNAQDKLGFIKVFGSEGLADALSDGDLQTDSDLYDSEDRQILKIYSSTDIQVNTSGFKNEYFYLYLFCSTIGAATITKASSFNKSLLSLNIGDMAYEKIFSPGLIITSDEQNVYAESNGSKFGFTPLLSTDRNFYSTNTVTREMVIDKTQTLVNRFKNGEAGTLTDMVNSIEFVLQTQGQTEDLIPELDKVRKSFPNKTNNNPVGNLYASLSQLLININTASPQTDKLERQKYSTGKVVDGRTATNPELLTLSSSAGEGYFIDPLVTRTATEEGALNSGVAFLNFEEMVKKESIFFSTYVDVERFYEVCEEFGLSGMKRALFSKMKQKTFEISVQVEGIALNVDKIQMNYSFQNPSNLVVSYYFEHIDEIPASPVNCSYVMEAEFEDSTEELFRNLLTKFTTAFANITEYQSQASSVYSYNLKTQNFNSFFRDTVKAYWETNDYIYPWQLAPTIYGILAYLTTDRFDSLDSLRTYTKNIIFNISPETGNLNHLNDFISLLQDFQTDFSTQYQDKFIIYPVTIEQQLSYSKELDTFGLVSGESETDTSGGVTGGDSEVNLNVNAPTFSSAEEKGIGEEDIDFTSETIEA